MKKIKRDIQSANDESKTADEILHESNDKQQKKKRRRKIVDDKPVKTKISIWRRLNRISLNSFIKTVVAICTFIIFAIGFYVIFIPHTSTFTIVGFAWTRESNISSGYLGAQSDWYLPSNGILQYTNEEIKSYEKVLDHYETQTEVYFEKEIVGYETNTNSSGENETIPIYQEVEKTREIQVPIYRDEPVYATKYYYNIEIWKFDHTETLSGYDKSPVWPPVDLDANQRIDSQNEYYYVCIQDKNQLIKLEVPYDDWILFKEGDCIKVKSSFFGDRIYQGVKND